jgi:hypothetical protein
VFFLYFFFFLKGGKKSVAGARLLAAIGYPPSAAVYMGK